MHRYKVSNEKKKQMVISLIGAFIEERKQLIELLEKEADGSFVQQVSLQLLSKKRIIGYVKARNGNSTSEIYAQIKFVLKELWFQLDQCQFAMELLNLKEVRYGDIGKILFCIIGNTSTLNVSISSGNLSSLYSLKDIRTYQVSELMKFLSH